MYSENICTSNLGFAKEKVFPLQAKVSAKKYVSFVVEKSVYITPIKVKDMYHHLSVFEIKNFAKQTLLSEF